MPCGPFCQTQLSVALTLFFVPVRFRTLSESETIVSAADTVVSAAEAVVSAAETAVSDSETVVSDSERVRKRTGTKNSERATLRLRRRHVLLTDCHLPHCVSGATLLINITSAY